MSSIQGHINGALYFVLRGSSLWGIKYTQLPDYSQNSIKEAYGEEREPCMSIWLKKSFKTRPQTMCKM